MQCHEAVQDWQAALDAGAALAVSTFSSSHSQLTLNGAGVVYTMLRVLFCAGQLDRADQLSQHLGLAGQLPCCSYAETLTPQPASAGLGSSSQEEPCRHHTHCQALLSSHVCNEAIYAAYIALLLRVGPLDSAPGARQPIYCLGDSHCLSGKRGKLPFAGQAQCK